MADLFSCYLTMLSELHRIGVSTESDRTLFQGLF